MSMANDVLRKSRRVVVVGASPDHARYGHEVLEAFHTAGYEVVAVNPKYDRIEERPSYPSLGSVPDRVDLVVLVLSPDNARRFLPEVPAAGIDTVWLPPGTATETTVKEARALGLTVVDDVCPVATLRRSKRAG